MNYFLMLIILGLGCGGYYEFTNLEQQHAADVQNLADLQAKLDPLAADNQKLTTDNAQLKKSASDSQTEIAYLTQQLQSAGGATELTQQKAFTPPVAAGAAGAPASSGNNLGNFAALDGKSYSGCTLLQVRADCIVISDSDGITQVEYSMMPPDLQKRFGYDSLLKANLTDAQVQALEAKRKAAAPVAGN